MGNWFSQAPYGANYRHQWLRHWIEGDEFSSLAHAGLRHIRFPVELEMFLNEEHPENLRPEFLADFDAALDEMLNAGLAVIVDFHARMDTKERLRTDDAFVREIATLWGAVARHLSYRDPDRVFLETMNEPDGRMGFDRWQAIQSQLFASMRAAAPNRTVIVTSDSWDAIRELVKLEPLPDRNVVYTFHFYEPTLFTHQGASWMHDGETSIAGLAYPAEAGNRSAIADRLADPKVSRKVLAYAADRGALAEQISAAVSWANRHHVPLYCGEFGVYAKVAPADSRVRWLKDVRQLCEQSGIGWAMWDYCGGFRLAVGSTPGHRQLDPGCLSALGLTPAP